MARPDHEAALLDRAALVETVELIDAVATIERLPARGAPGAAVLLRLGGGGRDRALAFATRAQGERLALAILAAVRGEP